MSKRAATTILIPNPQFNKRSKSNTQRSALNRTQSLVNPITSKPTAEKKNFDVNSVLTLPAFNTAWSNVIPLNIIPLGNTSTTRIGRKINIRSLLFRCATSSTSGNPENARVLIVYDKQTNGVTPLAADILSNAVDTTSPMNLNNSERFLIIADFLTEQTQSGVENCLHKPEYRKINLDTMYGTNTGTIGDINTGGLFLLACGTDSVGTSLVYTNRIRYLDM